MHRHNGQTGAPSLQRHRLMLVTAAFGLAGTLVVLIFPAVRFAYPSAEFHAPWRPQRV